MQEALLNYMRMREWRDVFARLHTLCAEHGWKENRQPANYGPIHRRCSPGCSATSAARSRMPRAGPQAGSPTWRARDQVLAAPGSALAKAGKWIMAAEQVETSALVRALHRAHRAGWWRRSAAT